MFNFDKFFENLSVTKLFVLNIVLTAMFWYFFIFLFKKELITQEQVQIPIIISLCLSFCWCTISYITSVGGMMIFLRTKKDENPIYRCMFFNLFFSVMTLSLLIIFQIFKQHAFASMIFEAFLGFIMAMIPTVFLGIVVEGYRSNKALKNKKSPTI